MVTPALLVVAQSLFDSRYSGWGFFTDWTVRTRYLIAIGVLIATVQLVRELRVVPIDSAAVVRLVVAAGAPLVAVIATQMPLVDLGKWIVGTIL